MDEGEQEDAALEEEREEDLGAARPLDGAHHDDGGIGPVRHVGPEVVKRPPGAALPVHLLDGLGLRLCGVDAPLRLPQRLAVGPVRRRV